MVLLYEKTPEEVWEATKTELSRRLYKVIGMSSQVINGTRYASVELRHHEEARQKKVLKVQPGEYKQDEELRPLIFMRHTQFSKCILVQGYDFEINELGEIKRLR